MVKARTLFIFEGPNSYCLTRGHPLVGDDRLNTKVKHKGIWQKWIPIVNLEDIYVEQPKQLIVRDRVLPGWQVVKIMRDFLSHEPFIPKLNVGLVAKLHSKTNEAEMWKKKYFEEKKKTITLM